MPAKNSEAFIDTAVKSTLRAMPRYSELIIIDDGSSDKTSLILNSISDQRVRIKANQTSKGIAEALNQGIQEARGEFLARMDSDDVVFPWRFSSQLRQFKREPDLDFLFSTAIVFGEGIRPYKWLPQLPLALSDQAFKHFLIEGNPAVHPSMMARTGSIRALGGYRNRPAEDLDLWLRASVAGYKFRRKAFPTLALRSHANQVTKQVNWRLMYENQEELQSLKAQLALLSHALPQNPLLSILRKIERMGLPKFASPWKR